MSQSSPARFLQLHTLTSYPAALLNRDDAGFAKRLPFGGAVRTRVSSQCLKRHWRRDDGPHSLGAIDYPGDGPYEQMPMAVRSRQTFDREIYRPLVAEGVAEPTALAVTEALMADVLQKSEASKKKAKDEDPGKHLHTGQVLVIGRPEVDFLLSIAREAAADHGDDPKAAGKAVAEHFKKGESKKNLQALVEGIQLGAGLDAALFGRMITSDILARCDAALHVAHAFTVHGEESEADYFSAVDDLLQAEGETGSGHINSSELTSGLYYGYVVVDVPLLVSNLTGCRQAEWEAVDRELAAEVVGRFLQIMATVSPGAKLGSTAPYAAAHLVLAEAGHEAPRTLANAFLQPVRTPPGGDPVAAAYSALASHLGELDEVYGAPSAGRRGAGLGPKELLADHVGGFGSLADLAAWAAERVA